MNLRRVAHSAGYLVFTVGLTGLGVTAWVINTIVDRATASARTPRATGPGNTAGRPRESQLSGRER